MNTTKRWYEDMSEDEVPEYFKSDAQYRARQKSSQRVSQPVGDAPEQWGPPRRKKRHTIVLVGTTVLAVIAAGGAINHFRDAYSLETQVEELNLEGQTQSEAERRLADVVDEDDHTVIFDDSGLTELESSEHDNVVSDVDVYGDTVEMDMQYNPADVIMAMDMVGSSYPDARRQLESQGYHENADYEFIVDSGQVYVEGNWTVADLAFSENKQLTEILITNSTIAGVQESVEEFSDGLQGTVEDYDDQLSREAEERAEGRTAITDLDIEGETLTDAERVLQQNDWHSSDYVIRTDNGMPVLNKRNWEVIEVDPDLEEHPVIFVGK